ncbi:MAG: metalloregulator ArsR/SmtB family transcription factor [Gammaproteobacteria bacterium]|nr:metalloregulator ArsR/SmtB family transcription factor [Gammaproteobacteria bacterium]
MDEMLEHAREVATLLKTIAHEVRLMVLCLLVKGERSVSELNQEIAVSQSALSQHLAVLRRENLVSTRRQAQVIYYSLPDENIMRIMEVLHSIYCASNNAD